MVVKCCIVLLYFSVFLGPVSGQCSGQIKTVSVGYTTVTISPPGNPNYDINQSCEWLASVASPGDRLLFRVTNMGLRCPDSMNIYQGTDTTGPVIGTFQCDFREKELVYNISPLGSIFVRFTSDENQDANETGFDLHVISGQDLSGSGCRKPQTLTATETKQYVTSPNFPIGYPSFSGCKWELSSDDSTAHVYIEIEYLEIEFVDFCFYDYLEIQESGTRIVRLCEQDIQNVWKPKKNYTSTGSSFTVVFLSDGATEFHGFVLSYKKIGGVNNGSKTVMMSGCVFAFSAIVLFITG